MGPLSLMDGKVRAGLMTCRDKMNTYQSMLSKLTNLFSWKGESRQG